MGAGAEVLPLRTGLTGKGSRVASLHQERGGVGVAGWSEFHIIAMAPTPHR